MHRVLSKDKALHLLKTAHYADLAKDAHALRNELHNPKEVSYTVFQIINYTNICEIGCSFCSFKNGKPYTLELEEIEEQARQAKARGAVGIFLQGGVNSEILLGYYFQVLEFLAKKLKMPVRGFSPVELFHLAKAKDISLNALLKELKFMGLSSVPGAGAEIMTPRMRKILAPKKLSAEDWCSVMEECHKVGLKGSANIVIGSEETPEEIIEHLSYIRDLQDRTGGFTSFIVWAFQPQTDKFPIRHIRSEEYIKTLALCRLFFHNIPNIEASVLGMGKPLGELALYSGANDISSVVLEERVMTSQGVSTEDEAKKFITYAGFVPVLRGLNY